MLEAQLEPYLKEHQVQYFFSKLRPKLQVAITAYQDLPIIKTGMIALAVRMETIVKEKKNLEKGSKSTHSSHGNEQSRSSKSPRGKGRVGQSFSIRSELSTCITVDTTVKKGHYFNCGDPNHWANACPKPKKNPNTILMNAVQEKDSKNNLAPLTTQ